MTSSGSAKGICFVINDYNWTTDTHYRHLYRLFEEIAKLRKTCVLVEVPVPSLDGHPLDEVVVIQHWRHPLLRIIEEFFLLWQLRIQGYNQFYVHYTKYGGILAPVIARLTGGKVFYWHCEEVMKHRESKWLSLASVRRMLHSEAAAALAMRLTHSIVTGNAAMVKHYQQAFGLSADKFRIISNYIDLAEFIVPPIAKQTVRQQLGLTAEDKVVLYVHRLVERKGAHHLPEIIQRVFSQSSTKQTKFLIIGDGPLRRHLESALQNLILDQRVRFLGAIPNQQIPVYYAIADLFIMPSDAEGFPRVLLEALASGLPVVATDVGGVSQLLEQEQLEFVCQSGDVQRFSEMIITLLQDPNKRQKLAQFGYQVAEKHSLERAVTTFLQMMDA